MQKRYKSKKQKHKIVKQSNRQIQSKSKRVQKKQETIKTNQTKEFIFNQVKSKQKHLTKRKALEITNSIYQDGLYSTAKELDTSINRFSQSNSYIEFSNDIITQLRKIEQSYEEIIESYNTLLVDIQRYDKYDISFLSDLYPVIREYVSDLQGSNMGQNFEKASPYNIISSLSTIIMDVLSEQDQNAGVIGILALIQKDFNELSKQAFYASSQQRMMDVLNQNDLLYDRFDDDIYELFKK